MKNGFTLIEILCTISLLAMLASVSAFMGLGAFQNTEASITAHISAAILRHARSEALHGKCVGSPCYPNRVRGVRFEGTNEIVFAGNSFDSNVDDTDEIFPLFASPSSSTAIYLDEQGTSDNTPLVQFPGSSDSWNVRVDRSREISVTSSKYK